jgi:glucose/arabinose dehydrogenase
MKKMIACTVAALSFTLGGGIASAGGAPLTTQVVTSGLSRPVLVTHAPGDFDRIFILEQRSGSTGRIRIFDLTTNTLLATPFLSQSVSTGSEQGLLGLAFHPDYASNGKFYINYTRNSGGNNTFIDEFTVSANPDVADAASRRQIMQISQPFSNHNGGWIGFGPDGYLYISMGDGGSGGDPGNRAQNTGNLLGKMLRLDVNGDDFPADNAKNYAIPSDNPFVGGFGADEIWAVGLRNAWRNSFDRETGDLWMGDVGQNAIEEIDFEPGSSPGGVNYGWRCYEGNNTYNSSGCGPSSNYEFPIRTYSHAGGNCSVTGGYVYRGCAIPELDGTYFYADYCSSQFWSLKYDGSTVSEFQSRTAELNAGSTISSFGEDAYGEIYICNLGGQVRKIVRDAPLLEDCDENGVEDACQVAAGNPPACGCNAADIAAPFGVLDLGDVNGFIGAFVAQDPAADIAAPFGVFDLADLQAFIAAFTGGCP